MMAAKKRRRETTLTLTHVVHAEAEEATTTPVSPTVKIRSRTSASKAVLTTSDMMAEVMVRAKADLAAWASKYERLSENSELRPAFAAVEKMTRRKTARKDR
jgi:hypothetical protein